MIFEGFSTENKKLVQTITTSAETLSKDIIESHADRLSSRGGHFTEDQLIPVYFAALIGEPMEESSQAEYHNMLYTLRDELIRSSKLLFYIEYEMKLPDSTELSRFEGIDASDREKLLETLIDKINDIRSDMGDVRNDLAKETLPMFLNGLDGEKMLETARTLIIRMERCFSSKAFAEHGWQEIPVLLYYGGIDHDTLMFLHFMSRLGIDVLYICSSKAPLPLISKNNLEGRMQIFELSGSSPVAPYPDKLVRTKFSTVAYNASKELDGILYSGDTMFRDFQFDDMQSITLNTTYDEIDVLWHQQAKYRPGFAVNDGKVTVPAIFAKISGVNDGDLNEYWDGVKQKLSPNTRLIHKSPSYRKYSESQLDVYKPYYSGKKILTEQLKNSPLNKYSFLSDSLQLLIFGKMQEAVDSGFLTLPESELVPMVIYVGTNIDREILKLLQKYDFTKDIPKLIVIDVIEDTFSSVECIQLLLYNLLGLDILVYTPTGYKNIETFLSGAAFSTHTMNEFKYSVHIPKFKIPDSVPGPDDGGLFGKLFRKGRK